MAAMKPRPAAALALLRDRSGGIEVLMLQRTQSAAFLGGAYVFAGGALDAADEDGRIVARVRGLGVQTPPVAYWVAAIRECFEEAGILLACDAQGQFVSAERRCRRVRSDSSRGRPATILRVGRCASRQPGNRNSHPAAGARW